MLAKYDPIKRRLLLLYSSLFKEEIKFLLVKELKAGFFRLLRRIPAIQRKIQVKKFDAFASVYLDAQ